MQIIQGIYEKDLIARLKDGDQTAFELLFHFYYPGLVMYSTQFTTDRTEAEEIVQDFFVRLWQRHPLISLTDSLKSYLFLSVKNGCLNYLKHKKVEEKYIRQMCELSNYHLVYDPDLYLSSELQEKVKQAIDLLPEKCREVFVLCRFEELKYAEVAEKLHISVKTVEMQMSIALKKLRNELSDYQTIQLFAFFSSKKIQLPYRLN